MHNAHICSLFGPDLLEPDPLTFAASLCEAASASALAISTISTALAVFAASTSAIASFLAFASTLRLALTFLELKPTVFLSFFFARAHFFA